ncbi:hypothetical protein Q644_03670 [Brucella intermedia 229E]|uniref:ABC transporter domain-containing protein n=1 Tax=Brucella intermedia 229E TaxID=1337887 RepID=U4VDX9_9HYPH|nr:hypothetical protein Q644_03670 [Brucella intermedia 229E]
MSGIEIVNLNKKWTTFHAVNDVNFTVEPGTLTVLLGPSGCGKSTSLRLIAGLDSVTSGQIIIGGKDVTNAPPAKRGLAMVFQSYALFPHLTVCGVTGGGGGWAKAAGVTSRKTALAQYRIDCFIVGSLVSGDCPNQRADRMFPWNFNGHREPFP